uniref:Uncharacterized protein n=1 Tax=Myoviridae sp. ctvxP16 TaxID=2825205 RepID=A0A8S5UTZ4_9CAUD|nr:MAG TPA: hypothetical protein [Myoviridae sp. ctvxP16]
MPLYIYKWDDVSIFRQKCVKNSSPVVQKINVGVVDPPPYNKLWL